MTPEQKCNKPLETCPAARKAFADRQAKLIGSKLARKWPNCDWYNDEDFCRAYNQIVHLTDEIDRLQGIVNDVPVAIEAAYHEGMEDGRKGYCDESSPMAPTDEERWRFSDARAAAEAAKPDGS